MAENEGARFWANVLSELKNRGLNDNAVYPDTKIQLGIVHMVRTSLRFVSWKDYKAVTADLKRIYQASTEAVALEALATFTDTWQDKYPLISKGWQSNWGNIMTLFSYPEDFRKAIYTTNAIESLNSVIRRVIKKRNVFPTDDAIFKVVWLAIRAASKKMDNAYPTLAYGFKPFYN